MDSSSSTYGLMGQLAAAIRAALGIDPGHPLLAGMIAACHRNALATTGQGATEDELLYFTQSKAQALARAPNIRNHLAVLTRAVPVCFLGEAFRAYRAAALLRSRTATPEEPLA